MYDTLQSQQKNTLRCLRRGLNWGHILCVRSTSHVSIRVHRLVIARHDLLPKGYMYVSLSEDFRRTRPLIDRKAKKLQSDLAQCSRLAKPAKLLMVDWARLT